jgi:hypothetical protein
MEVLYALSPQLYAELFYLNRARSQILYPFSPWPYSGCVAISPLALLPALG